MKQINNLFSKFAWHVKITGDVKLSMSYFALTMQIFAKAICQEFIITL